jgi:hypothetical protein
MKRRITGSAGPHTGLWKSHLKINRRIAVVQCAGAERDDAADDQRSKMIKRYEELDATRYSFSSDASDGPTRARSRVPDSVCSSESTSPSPWMRETRPPSA